MAGIWWWGTRRGGQAPGNAQMREHAPTLEPAPELPREVVEPDSRPPEAREWGVPPFEPLSIHTADFDAVPTLEGPMMVSTRPGLGLQEPPAGAAPVHAPAVPKKLPVLTRVARVPLPADPATGPAVSAPRAAPAGAPLQQKIITVRVCAADEAGWHGGALLAALESQGMVFGRYQVFHRKHAGQTVFCAASLVEPGVFDAALMPSQQFRGLSLFAVLPGPIEPLLTVDELFAAAHGLALQLKGEVQDAKGLPLSPERAVALRDAVARFQAALSVA